MKIQAQRVEVPSFNMTQEQGTEVISRAAAHCYKSSIPDREALLRKLVARGHLSPFEHFNISVEILTDVATYKALTRHRHCAFTIESTHFIAYTEGLEVIQVPEMSAEDQYDCFAAIEQVHKDVLAKYGKLVARSFLPQAQSAELTMTTNMREWYQIFDLRKGKENTPNMYLLMELIMDVFRIHYPFFMELYDNRTVQQKSIDILEGTK